MEKKIGQIIKEVVDLQNVKVVSFAKAIDVSRNNVYDIFERHSIDTDLLKKIGQYLNYDFFQHFIEPKTIEKIKLSEDFKRSSIFIEINLSEDEIKKIGIEEKIIKILQK